LAGARLQHTAITKERPVVSYEKLMLAVHAVGVNGLPWGLCNMAVSVRGRGFVYCGKVKHLNLAVQMDGSVA